MPLKEEIEQALIISDDENSWDRSDYVESCKVLAEAYRQAIEDATNWREAYKNTFRAMSK